MHENCNCHNKMKKKSMKGMNEFNKAENELETLSFVKKTGKKDRRKDDVFAKIGL